MDKRKKRILLFVFGFIALQLIAPLTYYLRDDPFDERFAWRMFSGIRLYQCSTWVSETKQTASGDVEQPLDLGPLIHHAWIGHLKRNRVAVIEALLERRCQVEDNIKVELENQCVDTASRMKEPVTYTMDCKTGEIQKAGKGV